MKYLVGKSSILLVSLTLFTGCVTFSSAKKQDDGRLPEDLDSIVVLKKGSLSPVKSDQGRKHWLDLRQSKSNSIKKIQGLLATGEYIAAERVSRKLLEKHPGNESALIALASSLALSGQHSLAAYYGKVLEKTFPNNSATLNFVGLAKVMTAAKLKDYEVAKEYFQRALDNSSTEVAAGLNLGYLQIGMGDANGASQTFALVTDRCPSCADSLIGEGIAFSRLGNNKSAKSKFLAATRINDKDAKAHYYLALSQHALGDKEDAEATLGKILDPDMLASNFAKDRAQTILRKLRSTRTESSDTQIAFADNEEIESEVVDETEVFDETRDTDAPEEMETVQNVEFDSPDVEMDSESLDDDFTPVGDLME